MAAVAPRHLPLVEQRLRGANLANFTLLRATQDRHLTHAYLKLETGGLGVRFAVATLDRREGLVALEVNVPSGR